MTGNKLPKWIWGLVPVLIAAFVIIADNRSDIKQAPAKRAAAAIEQQGFSWAPASKGKDAVGALPDIAGEITIGDKGNKMPKAATEGHSVAQAQERTEPLPDVSPYTWWASRKNNRIKLRGHVPSKADRQTILGIVKATMPELQIDDRMTIAGGAPPKQRWLGAITFLLNQVGQLKQGAARLSDMELVVTGEASSEAAYGAIRTALQTQLPAGVRLSAQDVVPPGVKPYVWAAHYKEGTVKLTGHVPSEDARQELLKHVRTAFADATIEDAMALGSGNPDGWPVATQMVVGQLSRLLEGQVSITDLEVSIEGVAVDEETATDVATTVRNSLPASFKSVEKVGVRKNSERGEQPKAQPGGKPEKTMAQPPVREGSVGWRV